MLTTERQGIRQTDLRDELGLSPRQIKAKQRELPAGAWWKVGTTIFWSEEAASGLRNHDTTPREPQAAPAPEPFPQEAEGIGPAMVAIERQIPLRVVKLARNANFVLCALDGVCVPVRVKRGMAGKLLKKSIQVERLDDGTLIHRP